MVLGKGSYAKLDEFSEKFQTAFDPPHLQSQKNPVSASSMLTGKFLRIRKVFATFSLLAEEFPDNLENVRMLHKISR